ncbi:hypothetical protein J6590_059347 [Homalodisca vitripennis]|nr:hypothetical protein J6590_059347 [Homalodisca vitripennis]
MESSLLPLSLLLLQRSCRISGDPRTHRTHVSRACINGMPPTTQRDVIALPVHMRRRVTHRRMTECR